jgi:hypothetical protein
LSHIIIVNNHFLPEAIALFILSFFILFYFILFTTQYAPLHSFPTAGIPQLDNLLSFPFTKTKKKIEGSPFITFTKNIEAWTPVDYGYGPRPNTNWSLLFLSGYFRLWNLRSNKTEDIRHGTTFFVVRCSQITGCEDYHMAHTFRLIITAFNLMVQINLLKVGIK